MSTRTRRKAGSQRPSNGTPLVAPEPPSQAEQEAQAREIVLRKLAMAPKSRRQLAQALSQKGIEESVQEQVLDRFVELGLIDDAAYASALVRSQQQSRGLAVRALARELRAKGVEDEVAQEVLAQVDPATEEELAYHLAHKKMRTMHGLDAQTQARRLASLLARKGYSASLTMRIVREVVHDAPEHLPD